MPDPQIVQRLSFELNDIASSIRDSRVTKRREGRQKLEQLLTSLDYLECLDLETGKLIPSESISIVTWPGVLGLLLEYVASEAEKAHQKSKPPEAALSKVLRHFVEAAELSRRRCSGLGCMLQRRVHRLFQHVGDVLETTRLSSATQFGKDYLSILRTIIEDKTYCLTIRPSSWNRIFALYVECVQEFDRQSEDTNDAHSAMDTIAFMLERYEGDISVEVSNMFMNFLIDLGNVMKTLHPNLERTRGSVIRIAVHFLFKTGRDVASSCPAIEESLHSIAFTALKGRDGINKEYAISYFRQLLALGGISPLSLSHLQQWALEESKTAQWRAASHLPASASLTYSQYAKLSLLATIEVHTMGILRLDTFESHDEASRLSREDHEESRGRKRMRRISNADDAVGVMAALNPPAAAPIACMILFQYGSIIPPHMHRRWTSEAMASLCKLCEDASVSSGGRDGRFLWLLRLLHALAITTPLDSTGRFCCDRLTWSKIWEVLVSCLNQEQIQEPERDVCLWILASIADQRLFPIPSTAHDLWGVPLLGFSPSGASVAFIEALFRGSPESAANMGLWELKVLKWLTSGPPTFPAYCSLAAAVEAYLRINYIESTETLATDIQSSPSFAHRVLLCKDESLHLLPWVWWSISTSEEEKFSELIRGRNFMLAKSKIVQNQGLEKKFLELMEASNSLYSGPAGLQMHEDAALLLRQMIQCVLNAPFQAEAENITQDALPHRDGYHQYSAREIDHGSNVTSHLNVEMSYTRKHLLPLMSTSTAAIHVNAVVKLSASIVPGGRQIPSCWDDKSPLSKTTCEAIQIMGGLLVDAISTQEGLTPDEEDSWKMLCSAIALHKKSTLPSIFAESMQSFLKPIRKIFSLDPSLVAKRQAAVNQTMLTQYSVKADAAHMVAAFDDDLDMSFDAIQTANPSTNRYNSGSSSGIVSSTSLAEEYKRRCSSLMNLIAKLMPVSVFDCTYKLLQQRSNVLLSTSNFLLLSEALCTAAAASVYDRCFEGPQYAESALENLKSIICWGKNSLGVLGRMDIVLDCARQLMAALHSPHGFVTAGSTIEVNEDLIFHCLDLCDRHYGDSSDSLRIRVGQAVVESLMSSCKSNRAMDEERIQFVIEWVKSLLLDSNYSARLAGIHLSQILFSELDDSQGLLDHFRSSLPISSVLGGESIEEHGDSNPPESTMKSPEYLETAIFMLGETIIQQTSLEVDCLLSLAIEGAEETAMLPLISLTLDWVSISLGYSDRYAFAVWYRPQLFYEWFVSCSMTVDQLMIVQELIAPSCEASLPTEDGRRKFIQESLPLLVTTLVFKTDHCGLETLAGMIGCSMDYLLEQNLDGILALIIPGQFSTDDVARRQSKAAAAFLNLPTIMQRAFDCGIESDEGVRIIAKILSVAQEPLEKGDGTTMRLPYFTPAVVLKALHEIFSRSNPVAKVKKPWQELINEEKFHFILMTIQERIQSAVHARHVLASLGSLQAALMLLQDQVAKPTTLRYSLSILLRLLRVPTLRPVCCSMLAELIPNAMHGINLGKESTGYSMLGFMLPRIVSSLSESIQDNIKREMGTKALVKLLHAVTVDAPPSLQEYLSFTAPVPCTNGMENVAQVIWKRRRSTSLVQQLEAFAEGAGSMSYRERQISVQALSSTLDDVGKLEEHLKKASERDRIALAAWRLALLGSDEKDYRLSEFAGKCLASLGPLPSQSIAFDAVDIVQRSLISDAQPGHISHESRGTRGIWTTGLRLLSDYLTDEDTQVVREAHSALKMLLRTREALDALREAEMDEMTRGILAIFADEQQPLSNPATATSVVEVSYLWRIDEEARYEDWICQLCHVLCSRADNASLFACRYIVKHKPAFAELLLPLAFEDLAFHASEIPEQSKSVSRTVAELICEGTLPICPRRPKVMRLLLRCLNHLRGRYLDAMEGNREFSAAKTWPKVFWLDLDYLEFATAAIQCRAYFSALVYIEQWCQDDNRGVLELPKSTNSQRSRIDRLLLEIYSRINEPDGLYAIAQSNDLLSQLRRSEREGDWSQVLVTCDLALQLPQQRDQQCSGEKSDCRPMETRYDRFLSKDEAVSGILCALANLGANSLLSLLNLTPRESVGGNKNETPNYSAIRESSASISREQRWEGMDSVTRMGQWQSLFPGNSFHELADKTLPVAVDALAAGSAERCSQAISSGRRELVAALATAGLESTSDINPALVRLQMLQEIAEAWDLRWPDLPRLGVLQEANYLSKPFGEGVLASKSSEKESRNSSKGIAATLEQASMRWRKWELPLAREGSYPMRASLQNLRLRLLRILNAPRCEFDALQETAVAARKASHYGQAMRYLFQIRSLPNVYHGTYAEQEIKQIFSSSSSSWHVEEAKLLWAKGQKDAALSVLLTLLQGNTAQTDDNKPLKLAYMESLGAKWMAETQRESSVSILLRFSKAAELLAHPKAQAEEGFASMSCRILYRLACYTDRLYRGIQERKSSSDWLKFEAVIQDRQRQLSHMRKQISDAKVITDSQGHQKYAENHHYFLAKQIRDYEATLARDCKERDDTLHRERDLLHQSLKAYGKCLQLADSYNLQAMFRVIQLWLKLGHDGHVVQIVRSIVMNVASYKFVDLIYQIASRLSSASTGPLVASGFQATLQDMLVRIGSEHPFHSLLQIFALKNADRGKDGKRQSNRGGYAYAADQERVKAAETVLELVSTASVRLKHIVHEYKAIIEEYIATAAIHVDRSVEAMSVPSKLHRKLRSLEHIPILTTSIPLDPSLEYADIPTVSSVESHITFPGGINKPKKLTLTDSKGQQRIQLIKGGSDDLRQDAVMQQFFRILNRMLAAAAATSTRRLTIRTYVAVPLSPASGLLEWVDNTKPLLAIIGHSRYRREGDLNKVQEGYMRIAVAHERCRRAHQGNIVPKIVRPAFDKICNQLVPVLHHYFLERYRQPGAWFEARLQYTRSVAVSSMAGHVIGLGDRHLSNILLDGSTAEVVHIDLGIAFEQGQLLPTPERVPFRLTRNIVDGMGVTGTEGAMRRCCEASLRVLRNAKEPLLTILEVFVHDPLYNWALTFKEMHKRQKIDESRSKKVDDGVSPLYDDEDDIVASMRGEGSERENDLVGNTDANRTLLRIRRKLEGIEYGDNAARSVEGQVAHLIAEAVNHDNLCRMYHGWGAHL